VGIAPRCWKLNIKALIPHPALYTKELNKMKISAHRIAAVVSLAACITCQAAMPAHTNITQSIPAEVIFCARLDLNAARKSEQAERMVNAIQQQFGTQLDDVDEFSSLSLRDVDSLWVNVAEEEATLIVLEGRFKTEAILNSPVVTNSKRLVRPGTVIAVELPDEKTGMPNLAVVVNEQVIAFGPPHLVDPFIINLVGGQSDWGTNGKSILNRLAASEAVVLFALLQLPEKELTKQPFLSLLVNAQVEMNIQERVTVAARIALQDEAKATALRDLISGFLGLGLASEIKLDYPDIKAAILDGLKLGTEGSSVTLSSTLDLELLLKLLRTKGLVLN
jgi:hypothetical protein